VKPPRPTVKSGTTVGQLALCYAVVNGKSVLDVVPSPPRCDLGVCHITSHSGNFMCLSKTLVFESQTPDAYILIRGTCGERRAVAPTSACAARPRANSVGLVQRRMAGVPVGDRLERVPSPK
jgi:hypothetical protein